MTLDKVKQSLDKYQSIVSSSKLFSSITNSISHIEKITIIRCLALGSPIDSIQARYQLALLVELTKYIGVRHISLYDPVFSDYDKSLFDTIFEDFKVEEEFTGDADTTLYFLPHAPLDLTEVIFNTNKPRYVLANDIISHTDRLTKHKLKEKYPTLATMVHVSTNNRIDDGFKVVKKRNRHALKEVEIKYDLENVYFKQVNVEKYDSEKGDPWGKSFSDLAFIEIVPSEFIQSK